MLFDYENGVRGGITKFICHYAVANNKNMRDYDKSKGRAYISYHSFSNQYGYFSWKNFLMPHKNMLKIY